MTQWDEDRKIIEASTPGPWWSGWWRDIGPGHNVGSREYGMVARSGEGAQAEADAAFIAAARTRWPAALDELAAALERIAELEWALQAYAAILADGRAMRDGPSSPMARSEYEARWHDLWRRERKWLDELPRLLSQDKPNG